MGIAFSGVSPRPPPTPTYRCLMIDEEGAAYCSTAKSDASHTPTNHSRAETQSPLTTNNHATSPTPKPWLLRRRRCNYSGQYRPYLRCTHLHATIRPIEPVEPKLCAAPADAPQSGGSVVTNTRFGHSYHHFPYFTWCCFLMRPW